jgi:hypothetical protein
VFSGRHVYFTFWVTNTGNVELADITLQDTVFDLPGTCTPDPLTPSAYFDCEIGPFGAVTAEHTNTVTVTVAYVDDCGSGAAPTDEDDANYLGIEVSYVYLPLVLENAGS